VVTENSALAAEPAVAAGRVFFTIMARSKYAIAALERGRVRNLAFEPDAFHLASSDEGVAWVELSSARSRVVRLKLDELPLTESEARGGPEPDLEVEDAEQPTVSRDGKWLAFIRETRGRGQLWTRELLPATAAPPVVADEWQAGNSAPEVLEACFAPDDSIVFAARSGASAALFALDPATRRISPLEVSSQPTRCPAVSPDGHWLAYSQRENGAWQLWVMKLATGEKRRLTSGDCNSIDPAWFGDSKNLVYATDCGRGLGMTALCRIRAVP